MKKFFVYLLLSEKDNRTYLGSTDNLDRRIFEHNNGQNKSTRHRRPLKLIYTEEKENILEARQREKFLKTKKGRNKLRDIFKKINIGE